MYDQFGEDGPGMPDIDMDDILRNFMPGFNRASQRRRQGENIQYPLKLSLKELYNGVTKRLKVSRKILCKVCNGYGTNNGSKPEKCSSCRGTGRKVIQRMLGPGIMQQHEKVCDKCDGTGCNKIEEKLKCDNCNGKKFTTQNKMHEINVPPGHHWGDPIVIIGGGDEHETMPPGDFIIYPEPKDDHSKFKRNGDDLIYLLEVTLRESLVGHKRIIEHLDGRKLLIESNDIIQHKSAKRIYNEGMPIPNRRDSGDLIIIYNVKYPKTFQATVRTALENIIPETTEPEYDDSELNEAEMTITHNIETK